MIKIKKPIRMFEFTNKNITEEKIIKELSKLDNIFLKLNQKYEDNTKHFNNFNSLKIKDIKSYKLKINLMKKLNSTFRAYLFYISKFTKKEIALYIFINKQEISSNNFINILKKYEDKEFNNKLFILSNILKISNLDKIMLKKIIEIEMIEGILNGNIKTKNLSNNLTKIKHKLNAKKEKLKFVMEKINYLYNSNFEVIHSKLVRKIEKFSHKKNDNFLISKDKINIINLLNTTKYYSNKFLATKVLDNINLQIKEGEFVVILGPSGSGKTTLLNIISGMDVASYGETYINSQNLMYMNQVELTKFRKDNIGYIFQQYGLLSNLTVRENIEIGANLQKNIKKRMDIDDLLKTVGMYEHRNKMPSELSGGQQQRVSIARSMAKNPKIIFGDEPTGAVDEEMSKQIMQLFIDINEKYKTTIIIVTHNPMFAELASQIIKVRNGKIFQNILNQNRKKINQLDWNK